MPLPTGQRGNPDSGRDTAPRTPACGSSVQIPQCWACLAPAEGDGKPLPAGHSGRHTSCGVLVRGWAAADEGRLSVSAQEGERTRPSHLSHPYPPSLVQGLGGPAAAGRGGRQVGRRSPVQEQRESKSAPRGHRSRHFHTHRVLTLTVVAPSVTA